MNKIMVILLSGFSGANFTSFAYEGQWMNLAVGFLTLAVATQIALGDDK